jgi:hypothetical protein
MADQRPADDLTIPGDERLYIRFYASPDSVAPLPGGEFRPNSGALLPRRKEEPISCDRASLCTPQETRDRGGHAGPFHVAVITVATVRQMGLRVTRDPIPDGEEGGPNPAHCLVHGSRESEEGHLTGGLKRPEAEKLARASRLAIPPLPAPAA